MPTRYSLEADFGLKPANLLAKLQNDQPGSPAWRSKMTQLLRREQDEFTLDEIESIAEIIYTKLDAGVLRDPDGYTHGVVKVANSNRMRQEQVLEQIVLLRSKKKRASPAVSPPAESKPGEKGIVLESINTSRLRVVRDGKVVGYIWRTRTKGGHGEHDQHSPGWTHSRSHELFVGSSSKLAAREDLIAMVDAGKNSRTKNPAWLVRQMNLGEEEARPARRVKVQEKGEAQGSTWRIGLFKSARGKLSASYVNASGEPLPYERKRVGDKPILLHRIYRGMTYAEARQKLLAEAEQLGIG